MILFEASAYLLAYEYLGVEVRWQIPSCLYQSVTLELVNCNPLSVSIVCKILNQQMMFFQTNYLTVAQVILGKCSASIHFEKLYIAAIKYSLFPWAFLRGPTRSMPHCMKGHDPIRVLSSFACWWFISAYLWHLSQVLAQLVASCCMVSQQYSAVSAFWANDLPPTCWHILRNSLRICKPTSEMTHKMWGP